MSRVTFFVHIQLDAITRHRVLEITTAIEMTFPGFLHEHSSAESLRGSIAAIFAYKSRKYSSAFDAKRRENWDTYRVIHYAASNLAGDLPPFLLPPNREWQSPFLNTQLPARLERTNKSSLRGLGNKAPINGLIIRLPVGLAKKERRDETLETSPGLFTGRWIIRNRR